MAQVRVVTDSLAWLPAEVAAEHRIAVVPLHIFFGEERFTETVDLTNEQFYQRLRGGEVSTTSQPSPGEFQVVFQALAAEGADAIVCITASSKLSGTYNSAVAAARESAELRIEVIDTQLAALAQGMLAIAAARAAADGATLDEVIGRVQELRPRSRVALTVETLDFLYKGGRIGRARHLIGSLLRFRPVLHLDDGELAPLDRPRTRQKAIARLVQYAADHASSGRLAGAGILHADSPEGAAELRRQVEARFQIGEMYESQIGPVIGTYVGPDALGFCFLTE